MNAKEIWSARAGQKRNRSFPTVRVGANDAIVIDDFDYNPEQLWDSADGNEISINTSTAKRI